VSAAMVGAGGGLYAQFLGSMTVDQFYLEMTFVTLAMLVVGGIGSLSGAVIGVVAVTFVIEFLRTFEHGFSIDGVKLLLPSGSQEIGLGVVMALILILRPTGLTRGREIFAPRRDRAMPQKASAGFAIQGVDIPTAIGFDQPSQAPERT
jgi:branched-chain amino acid transport system permease protein